MLSDIRCQSPAPMAPVAELRCDDRYSRSMEEDMKEAIGLLFKFKAGLDKLHHECTRMIERMMANPSNRY